MDSGDFLGAKRNLDKQHTVRNGASKIHLETVFCGVRGKSNGQCSSVTGAVMEGMSKA